MFIILACEVKTLTWSCVDLHMVHSIYVVPATEKTSFLPPTGSDLRIYRVGVNLFQWTHWIIQCETQWPDTESGKTTTQRKAATSGGEDRVYVSLNGMQSHRKKSNNQIRKKNRQKEARVKVRGLTEKCVFHFLSFKIFLNLNIFSLYSLPLPSPWTLSSFSSFLPTLSSFSN